MEMAKYLGDIKKHYLILSKQVKKQVGNEKSLEILKNLQEPSGNENPQERAKWAFDVTECLEKSLETEDIIKIRQECACVKSNKYSAYNQKYFPEIREKNSNKEIYLKAIAEFLSGRPRIGKQVEYLE
ncbi:MAG: hypothetical protein QM644_12005, partial [Mobilitalea sp.]